MRCPKCSYTSFDYNDNCPKCGAGLVDVRTLLQIIAVSPEARAPSVGVRAETAAVEIPQTASAAGGPPRPGRDAAEEEAADVLEDLDFDESFEELVEPTSYSVGPAGASKTKPGDELLDLDFGDLFADDSKKGQ